MPSVKYSKIYEIATKTNNNSTIPKTVSHCAIFIYSLLFLILCII